MLPPSRLHMAPVRSRHCRRASCRCCRSSSPAPSRNIGFGLLALACGLSLSFTVAGIFFATIGLSIGIDSTPMHRLAGALLIAFGAVMARPGLQQVFAGASSRACERRRCIARASQRPRRRRAILSRPSARYRLDAVCGPDARRCEHPGCSGQPTGRGGGRHAGLRHRRGHSVARDRLAVSPASQQRRAASRIGAAETARRLLGASLVVVGFIVLFGADKAIETWLVDHSPTWLTELTTRL